MHDHLDKAAMGRRSAGSPALGRSREADGTAQNRGEFATPKAVARTSEESERMAASFGGEPVRPQGLY